MNKSEMKILFESEYEENNEYNPIKDKGNYKLDDERKPVLKLSDINRLKKIRIQKRKELMQDNTFIPVIYGSSPDENSGLGGMPM